LKKIYRDASKKIVESLGCAHSDPFATVTEFNEGSIVVVVAVGRYRCSVCVRRISLEILKKLT